MGFRHGLSPSISASSFLVKKGRISRTGRDAAEAGTVSPSGSHTARHQGWNSVPEALSEATVCGSQQHRDHARCGETERRREPAAALAAVPARTARHLFSEPAISVRDYNSI